MLDPSWLALVAAFIPLAGVAGGLIGAWWGRKGTKEADNRGRREELMRQLRWASELAVLEDPRQAQLGVDQLRALYGSELFSESEKALIDASLRSVLHEPLAEIEAAEAAGDEPQVYQKDLEAIEAVDLALEDDEEAVAEDDNGEEDVRGA